MKFNPSGGSPPVFMEGSHIPAKPRPYAMDGVIETLTTVARTWQLVAIGEFVVVCGLAGGLFWEMQKADVAYFRVDVDPNGEIIAISQPIDYAPKQAEYVLRAETVVKAAFTKILSAKVNQDNYDIARAAFVGSAAERYKKWRKASDDSDDSWVRDAVDERTVTLINTKPSPADEKTVNVRWRETDYRGGRVTTTRVVEGNVTMEYRAPKTRDDKAFLNRLNIVVTGFAFETETGVK